MQQAGKFLELRERANMSQDDCAKLLHVDRRTIQRWESGQVVPKPAHIKVMYSRLSKEEKSIDADQDKFRFIDLFAGIGGLRLGFESIGGKCIYTSEWDKFACSTYRANFPNDSHQIAGDITQIDANDIPSHDVLLAGFPCQPFSIAGVSKKNALQRPHGFKCNIQGTLFFDVARIIKHHMPSVFVLENVKNLASHDKGRTFRTIRETLENDLGYNVQAKIINAKHWVPQNRQRIFIVGFRDETNFDIDQLIIPLTKPTLADVLEPREQVSDKYTLSSHLWTYLQDYAKKHQARGNGFGYGLVGPNDIARTLSARYYKDGSEILIKNGIGNPRRLTPRECARLMGYDGCGEANFKIPVSDTQAYKQFGNSVAVPVVKAVAELIRPHLLTSLQK